MFVMKRNGFEDNIPFDVLLKQALRLNYLEFNINSYHYQYYYAEIEYQNF